MKRNLRDFGTGKNRIKEIPDQSEHCLRLELESSSSFSQKAEKMELAEIIDVKAIQSLMDDFYKLTNIPIGLNDLKGNVLVGAGWQDICTKFHRVHPETSKYCVESDIKLSSGVTPGEFKMYRCRNNMWDIVTPVMIGDQHVGYVFGGQFFFEDEPLDYELFRSQAKKYGFNEKEYIAALEKVPRLSREAVDTGMGFFVTFANMLSQLSYSNIKLAQSLAERDILVDALQESKKDFDRAQTVGNIGSWRLDVCKNELKWSDESHRIFGIPKGIPLTYETFLSTVHPDDREYVDREWKAGLEGKPYDIEHRIIVDGKTKWVREKAYLEFDKDGAVVGGFGITQDITGRKRVEEALKKAHETLEEKVKERTGELEEAYNSLKENERRLSEAQKTAHIGSWDGKFTTDKLYWSDELYRIFGLKPQELEITYNVFLNYVHPEDRDYVDNAVKRAFNGEPFDVDYRIILANGEERTIHSQGEVTFDEKSTPVRISGTAQDITERKRAEERIRTLANVVESSDDGIITESLDGIITSWNKGAEQVYGYSAEEVIGKPISILEPPHLSRETKELAEWVQKGERIQQYETLRLRKDGRIINVSITISPVFDIYGKLTAVSVIYRDITKRKEAEETLVNLEIIRKKEIHHRIKNNLQVISSLLDLQAEKFGNRECIKDWEVLEAFRESQDRVMSIALIHEELHEGRGDDALNFSLYLQRLLHNLFQTYRFGNTDICLNLDLEENIFFNMDTAVPLGMIVNELISNSLKYAFSGLKSGEIEIKLFKNEIKLLNNKTGNELNINEGLLRKDYRYTLIVSDNGIGVPEEIRFGNSDTLGLQLVSLLVDQLDGCIELKKDYGAKFIILFNGMET